MSLFRKLAHRDLDSRLAETACVTEIFPGGARRQGYIVNKLT
jgi:hypothetical protein